MIRPRRLQRARLYGGALLAAIAEFGRVFVKAQRAAVLPEPPRVSWPADILAQHHPDDGGFEQ